MSELSEEQQELVALLRGILAQRAGSTATRSALQRPAGFDSDLWRLLCEDIGVASLAIPEQYGGAGFTLMESQLVLEELGYALVPSPYLGSVAIAAQAVLASGDDAAAARLLPGIAEGTVTAALGWADPSGRWAPEKVAVLATPHPEGWTVSGTVPFVIDGIDADELLVIARTPDGPQLFEILDPATVERRETPAMDLTLRLATLRLDATAARPLGGPDVLETARALTLTALSAVQAGTASRALDMTAEYAKQRVQFGRPIGSFQAIKHRLAEMHVQAEVARTATRAAARALSENAADQRELATIAKAVCSDALTHIASETIQLHGGIAITWEHDAHLIFKRAHALGELLGTAREQRARAAEWALLPR